jgi:hypothetical protein
VSAGLPDGPVRPRDLDVEVGQGAEKVGHTSRRPLQGTAGFSQEDSIDFVHYGQPALPAVRVTCAALAGR